MKLVKPILLSLGPLVIGALLGYYFESRRAENDQRLRYLHVDISDQSDIINTPEIIETGLEITLNGRPIANLSEVLVEVYNLSDRDYQDVPVYIELIPTDGQNISIVSEDVYGADGLHETVTPLVGLSPPEVTGAIRYGYSIKTVNRLGGFDPVFQARYLFLGSQVPDVQVSIDKVGVLQAKYDFWSLIKRSWWERDWPIIPLMALLVVVFIYLLLYNFVWAAKRFRNNVARDRQYFERAFKEALSQLGERPDLREFVTFIRAAMLKYAWEDTSKLDRFIVRWNSPIEPEQTEQNKPS